MFRHQCRVKPKRYFKISRLIGESVCFGMHRFFRWIRLILAFGAKECAKRFFSHRPHIYTHETAKQAAAAPIRQQKTWSNKKSGTQRYHSKTGFPVCVCVVLFYLWPWCCPNKFLAFQSKHIHFSKSTFMVHTVVDLAFIEINLTDQNFCTAFKFIPIYIDFRRD